MLRTGQSGTRAIGRVPVATSVGFLDAKQEAPGPACRAASGKLEGQLRVDQRRSGARCHRRKADRQVERPDSRPPRSAVADPMLKFSDLGSGRPRRASQRSAPDKAFVNFWRPNGMPSLATRAEAGSDDERPSHPLSLSSRHGSRSRITTQFPPMRPQRCWAAALAPSR